MKVNKNQAHINWQYPMFHKYQADPKKCRRTHWTQSHTMEVYNNQAEVNWQYPMVHKYQAEANKCPSSR